MKYGYTGYSSTIAQEIRHIVRDNDDSAEMFHNREPHFLPTNLDYYFFCAGFLAGKSATEIQSQAALDTINVNMLAVISACEKIFKSNAKAKICVIGSMSGINGSYDMTYAAAKAGLHMYVKNKVLGYRGQHLVCVAPTIIEDSGMTERRKDHKEIIQKGRARRHGRWLLAKEVAETAFFAVNLAAMCNTVIELTGGNN